MEDFVMYTRRAREEGWSTWKSTGVGLRRCGFKYQLSHWLSAWPSGSHLINPVPQLPLCITGIIILPFLTGVSWGEIINSADDCEVLKHYGDEGRLWLALTRDGIRSLDEGQLQLKSLCSGECRSCFNQFTPSSPWCPKDNGEEKWTWPHPPLQWLIEQAAS